MPRRKDSINVSIQLTPEEHEALDIYAKSVNRDKTVIIRAALRQVVPDFPPYTWSRDDRWKKRGEHEFKDND